MKLAYLLNSYPMTSTTFIRREIAAIERAGVPVKRFAVRQGSERLVDPQDMSERGRVEYLLTGKSGRLLGGLGRVPGDITVHKGNSTFYFPIVTCLLLSAMLSLLAWLFR